VIAYLDASAVLRIVLGEAGALGGWQDFDTAIASALTEVECLRTLDRLARHQVLSVEELSERRAALLRLLEAVELIDISRPVLRRAAEPFPTPLGTLDAIHLATALAWRDANGAAPALATHDRELAMAARSVGLDVLGA